MVKSLNRIPDVTVHDSGCNESERNRIIGKRLKKRKFACTEKDNFAPVYFLAGSNRHSLVRFQIFLNGFYAFSP